MCSYIRKREFCGCTSQAMPVSKIMCDVHDIISFYEHWDDFDTVIIYLNKNSEYNDRVMDAFEFIEAVYGYNFDTEEGII